MAYVLTQDLIELASHTHTLPRPPLACVHALLFSLSLSCTQASPVPIGCLLPTMDGGCPVSPFKAREMKNHPDFKTGVTVNHPDWVGECLEGDACCCLGLLIDCAEGEDLIYRPDGAPQELVSQDANNSTVWPVNNLMS